MTWGVRRVLLAGLALAMVPAAGADEVFTRSGGHLTGEIVERGPSSLTVDIGIGRVELPLSYVERIVPGDAPLTVYRQRAQVLAAGDAAGWLALGRWAREHDLSSQADEAFRHVVERDSGNAAAQEALGRTFVDGQWMTRDDANAARGLVLFEGSWTSPEERQVVLAERAQAAERARQEADLQAALRESEARVREAEAQARVAEAQARGAEADAAAAERNASAFPYPLLVGNPYVPTVAVAVGTPFIGAIGGPFMSAGFGGGFAGRFRRPSRFVMRADAGMRRQAFARGALSSPAPAARRPLRRPGCSR